jgi:TonB family protein
MTPVVDNNKQTADLRAQAKTNPAGLAAMLQAQTDQYQQGAAARTQRASQLNQDMKYCYQELDKVHKQEQEQQAILKYASVMPKVDDLPIPGRKVIPPLWLHRQAPEYTEQALANKINGSVLLFMVVDETGHPQNIKVLRGLGYGLDEKAVSSMVGSVFQPAKENGSFVPFDMQLEVSFDVR